MKSRRDEIPPTRIPPTRIPASEYLFTHERPAPMRVGDDAPSIPRARRESDPAVPQHDTGTTTPPEPDPVVGEPCAGFAVYPESTIAPDATPEESTADAGVPAPACEEQLGTSKTGETDPETGLSRVRPSSPPGGRMEESMLADDGSRPVRPAPEDGIADVATARHVPGIPGEHTSGESGSSSIPLDLPPSRTPFDPERFLAAERAAAEVEVDPTSPSPIEGISFGFDGDADRAPSRVIQGAARRDESNAQEGTPIDPAFESPSDEAPAAASGGASARTAAELELAIASLVRSGRIRLPVTGESMIPVLVPGDEIEVVACAARDLELGDIALFAARDPGNRVAGLVVHRLLLDRREGLIARGDGSRSVDPVWSRDAVIGRVEKRIRRGVITEISPRRGGVMGTGLGRGMRRAAWGLRTGVLAPLRERLGVVRPGAGTRAPRRSGVVSREPRFAFPADPNEGPPRAIDRPGATEPENRIAVGAEKPAPSGEPRVEVRATPPRSPSASPRRERRPVSGGPLRRVRRWLRMR